MKKTNTSNLAKQATSAIVGTIKVTTKLVGFKVMAVILVGFLVIGILSVVFAFFMPTSIFSENENAIVNEDMMESNYIEIKKGLTKEFEKYYQETVGKAEKKYIKYKDEAMKNLEAKYGVDLKPLDPQNEHTEQLNKLNELEIDVAIIFGMQQIKYNIDVNEQNVDIRDEKEILTTDTIKNSLLLHKNLLFLIEVKKTDYYVEEIIEQETIEETVTTVDEKGNIREEIKTTVIDVIKYVPHIVYEYELIDNWLKILREEEYKLDDESFALAQEQASYVIEMMDTIKDQQSTGTMKAILDLISSGNLPSVSYSGVQSPMPNAVHGKEYRFSSIYGDTAGRNTPHNGIDYATRNTEIPISAAGSGEVVRVMTGNSGYGNGFVIYHGNSDGKEIFTVYGHCSSVSVSVGQAVSVGDTVAMTGTTGNSTGIHLHFEVIEDGYNVNPSNYTGEGQYPTGYT